MTVRFSQHKPFLRSQHIIIVVLQYHITIQSAILIPWQAIYQAVCFPPPLPRLSVAGCPGARRGVPVDLHVTMEGPGCTGGRVRGGATNPRIKNCRGPGARQTWADTKLRLNIPCQARCQVNSCGDSGWPATAMCL